MLVKSFYFQTLQLEISTDHTVVHSEKCCQEQIPWIYISSLDKTELLWFSQWGVAAASVPRHNPRKLTQLSGCAVYT